MERSSGFVLSDTSDRLWAEAPQASTRTMLCLLYGAQTLLGATALALVGWLIHRVYGMEWRVDFAVALGVIGLSVIGLAGVMFLLMVRRQHLKHTIAIADGRVCLETPEQAQRRHEFDLADLAAASLSRSGRWMHRSTLIIRRHKGWRLKGFSGCGLADLTLLVDAVNRRIVQKERYVGFQVMVSPPGPQRPHAPQGGAEASVPVLPPAMPLSVSPVAPELTPEPPQ